MITSEPADLGLRERKKIRTRAAIRDNAMRLFHEQGYTATTVDQIAEAADVSPSTFFRYFPSKEALVLTDDLDPLVVAALEQAPAEMSPIAAVRHAMTAGLNSIDEATLSFEMQRQALIASEPELRSAVVDDFRRNVLLLTEAMGRRIGRDPESIELKVFAGAIIGAIIAATDPQHDFRAEVGLALDLLEKGLPL